MPESNTGSQINPKDNYNCMNLKFFNNLLCHNMENLVWTCSGLVEFQRTDTYSSFVPTGLTCSINTLSNKEKEACIRPNSFIA
jgi:hypothetical protein